MKIRHFIMNEKPKWAKSFSKQDHVGLILTPKEGALLAAEICNQLSTLEEGGGINSYNAVEILEDGKELKRRFCVVVREDANDE